MPELKKLEELTDSLKRYILLNIEIVRLEATKHVSVIGSTVVGSFVVGISVFLFVFSLSIGLGFYLSALLGDSYSGFAIIAGFYFLLAIILFLGRKKFIEKPLRDKIIKKILEEKES
jgi:hypothetical protein